MGPANTVSGTRGAAASAASKNRKKFSEQNLPLPDGSGQCPFFNKACDGMNEYPGYPAITTDQFLEMVGCGNKIGATNDPQYPRLWSIVASSLSGLTFGLSIVHMVHSSSVIRRGSALKFIIATIALVHAAVCGYSAYLQSQITMCLTDSVPVEIIFAGSTLIMVSMIALCFAGGVMFFCAIGMALSSCVSCCGAPPGNAYQGNNIYQQGVQINMMQTYPQEYPYGNLPPPAQNPGYAQPPQNGYPSPQQNAYPPQQAYDAPYKQY
ncbi:transmembrane protein, putative [Bodo saltans]|uniref:Transmembrane protein, putative n=1 Tax=Bodo saltans TaxID=75058 RepID=A0A0S4IR05_BODSA|nr:transmembrane protein, putative [Bodo saltans]|eukprot:CUE65751.1 transmembrane protein, putative [Bodo saltans]